MGVNWIWFVDLPESGFAEFSYLGANSTGTL